MPPALEADFTRLLGLPGEGDMERIGDDEMKMPIESAELDEIGFLSIRRDVRVDGVINADGYFKKPVKSYLRVGFPSRSSHRSSSF